MSLANYNILHHGGLQIVASSKGLIQLIGLEQRLSPTMYHNTYIRIGNNLRHIESGVLKQTLRE